MEGARPAEPGDVPACARLLADAEEAATRLRGGPLLLTDRPEGAPPVAGGDGTDALRAWADQPDHVLLAGTLDDAVVGVGAAHVRDLFGQPLGVIDCLYVEREARDVGVGSALCGALVARLAELGCQAVDAPALPGDRETKQRFEAAGFSARLLVLHRRLP